MQSTPWHIEDAPPDWFDGSAEDVARLRERCGRVGIRDINLNDGTLDLDSNTYEQPHGEREGLTYAARIAALLRALETKELHAAEAKRDRVSEASEWLRRRFGRRGISP